MANFASGAFLSPRGNENGKCVFPLGRYLLDWLYFPVIVCYGIQYHVIRVYWQKRKIGIFRLYNQPRLFLSNVHLFSSMLRPEKVRCSIELLLANRHQFLLIFGDFLGFRPRQNSGMAPNSCVCRPHSRRLASSKTGLSGTWLYTKVGHTIVRYYASGVGHQSPMRLKITTDVQKNTPAGTIWSQPALKGY